MDSFFNVAETIHIIGSGIAGLATAARLAGRGAQVTVWEQNPYPGGKVTVVEGKGYRFDAGPSLFTLPQLLDQVFEDCGKNPRNYYQYRKHPVACRYFWDDQSELTAWGEAGRFAEEVEKVLGEPAAQVMRYLRDSQRIYEQTTPVFLERSLHRLKSYLNRETVGAISQMHRLGLFGNLHRRNRSYFRNPKLVQLFDRFATYNGSSPYLTPGVMSSIPHLEHNVGTYYPEGGLHSVSQSLYKLACDLGVQFHFNSRVDSIKIEAGRATGLQVNGEFQPADQVVSNMDIVPTYRRLMPQEPAPERTLNQERSSSALIFYWGINRQFAELDLHNIFFSNDYRGEFNEIFNRNGVIDDPTIYVNISSKLETGDAPAYGENWFVMINVPGDRGQNWPELIQKVRASVIRKLNERLGVSLEDHIEFESVLSPPLIEEKTASYQGSLYGASSNSLFSAFLRHPNFSRRIKSLYFCGGSVHPGGGIPLCLLSARIVDGLMSDNLKIDEVQPRAV